MSSKTFSDPEKYGINRNRIDAKCANCGGNMAGAHRMGSKVKLECQDCPTTGSVTENRLKMIKKTSGTVLLVPKSEEAADVYGDYISDDALHHPESPLIE